MKLFKIVDKYKPSTIALIRSNSAENAIKKYRRITNDFNEVIAIESHISLKAIFPIIMTLLQILFIGCGKPEQNLADQVSHNDTYNGPITVDAELQPYLTRFETKTNIQVTDVSMILTNDLDDPTHAGECHKYSNGQKIIKIKQDYWANLPEGYRIQLVDHELGHCRLNLDHNDSLGAFPPNNSPRTIMYSINFNLLIPGYPNSEDQYLNALIHNQLL